MPSEITQQEKTMW